MINYLELFAGIRGFRKALTLICNDFSLQANCIGFSEIDKYALDTYKSNFNTSSEKELGDIVSFTNKLENIQNLSDFSLLMGGFPCQSFSMMGKQKGLEDERGDLFFRIIDILKVKQPNFVLLENVKNLKTHNKGETFSEIRKALIHLGYHYLYFDVFNTANFALAQTRNRLYIFASKIPMPNGFSFTEHDVLKSFKPLNGESSILRQKNILDVLDKKVDAKYYLSEKIKPTILANGSKNFVSKSEINQLIARPLTATMVKMHRACQDNYFSDAFICADQPYEYLNNTFTKEEQANHSIRKLTPKEALFLQGFEDNFYKNAVKKGISDHQLYKQAGNAVSVNTVYAIFYHLFIKYEIHKLS